MRQCSAFFRCRGLGQAAFLLALLAWPALSRAQAILSNDIVEPRSFGYVVGDKIRREVNLSLDSGYRLDAAGLPKAGRIDRWLELAAPELSAGPITDGRRYRLVLTYQIFNAPRMPETLTIPQLDLRIVGVGNSQVFTTLVPALRVTVVPVTSGIDADPFPDSSLQPDRAPAPLPVHARQMRLAWIGAALAALLLITTWRRGLLALEARRNLPFARAVRELKRLEAAAPDEDREAGLRIVHEAVNRTAGRAVFAHNLHHFLAAHPEFAGLREDFNRLFAASARVFFGDAAAGAAAGSTVPALLRLCRLGRRIERRAARPVERPSSGTRSREELHAPGD